MSVAATVVSPSGWPPSHRVEAALRDARLCYDHMAGRLGVSLCDMMARRGHLVLADGGTEVTDVGARFLTSLGVDLGRARGAKRRYCRSCIDWTERRLHISGAVGAALAEAFFEHEWISRIRDSRALTVTPRGRKKLTELGVVVDPSVAGPQPRLSVASG
jgi:hypothetical protein